MEGAGTEPTLVVEKFVAAMPDQKCEDSTTVSGITSTRWRPVEIGKSAVVVAGQQKEPWIVLEPKNHSVTGSGGCNRITGSYAAGRDTLRFQRMVSTLMACPDMETEKRFLKALGETRRFSVSGRMLTLLDARGRVLARLEERNLK